MAAPTADALLRKLRRIEANMICPNCETRAPQGVGFGNVCVKFKTFVCDLCKTSHQAISHRVKSITMSNWTMDEVNELTDKMSGGNAAAAHIWLAKAPPCGQRYPGGSRPKAGDRIEVFKQFVLDAYEYGKFRSESPYVPSGDSLGSSHTTPVHSKASSPSPMKRAVSGGSSSLDSSRTNSPQFLKPPATGSSLSRSSTGDDGHLKPSTDPFQSSFTGSTDPFGFPSTNKPAAASAPLPKPKPKTTTAEANLIDFTDTTTIASITSTKAIAVAPPLPPTAQQSAPTIQPPIPSQAPPMASFDPFGADLLTPVSHPSSGVASPLRYHNTTQSHSTPNLSLANYPTMTQNTAASGPWSGNASPVPSNSNNNILDLLSGLTYDSTATITTTAAATRNGVPVAAATNQWNRTSPMVPSSSAISQIDVFGAMNSGNGSGGAGRWPAPAPALSYNPNSMGGMGMGMGMGRPGAPIAMTGYGAQRGGAGMMPSSQSQQQSMSGKSNTSDSFDFLQDTMRQQLSK